MRKVRWKERGERIQKHGLRCLLAFQKLCNSHGIFIFLDAGTLLGVIRDNDFIKDDKDIDIGTLDIDENKINKLKNEWTMIMENNCWNDCWIDLINYHKVGEYYVHRWKGLTLKILDCKKCTVYIYVTADTFQKFKKIKFKGHDFYIPDPPEKRLDQTYEKDWRIPRSREQCKNPQVFAHSKPRNEQQRKLAKLFEEYFRGRDNEGDYS